MSRKTTATVIKKLNEVNKICLVEIELALLDLDHELAGAWDTVRGLKPQDTSTLALEGLSAPAEAAGGAGAEVGADAFDSGLHGQASPLDPIRHLSPLLSWRWKLWRRWLRA